MKKIISILLCCCLIISFAFVFCPTISAAESWLWPAEDCYIVSSNYGLRDLYGTGEFNNYHYGIDIIGSTTYGMPVRAAKSGTIYEACNTIADDAFVSNSCGNYVAINHGDGTYSIYMHMRPNGVKTSGTVKQGETIGYIGNTGESYGAHLHFQIYTNPSNRNGSTLNPMPTNSNIRIQNEYVLPSGWASAKTTYSFEAGSITPPVEVVKTVNCKRTVQLPARVVNLYWNPTDTSRATYFDYGPLASCPTYAEMSDGSVWYKVNVTHQGQSTQMWFKLESDMTVTKVHTYGAVQYEYDHPHYAYQVCACGQVGYTGDCGTRSDCATCNPPTISGSCGANVKWSLDTKTGKLTISGTGAMFDWNGTDKKTPWYDYRDSIQSVSIANGVTDIGDWTFFSCYKMTSMTIPSSVTTIGAYAFNNCRGLKYIAIPDKVTSIGEGAFEGCSGLTAISIPDSVTSIGYDAFRGCSNLKSITIPDSVTTIDHGVFYGCSSLTNITVPDSVTVIYNSAFSDCNALTDVFFLGTEAKWNTITIGIGNEPLKTAKVYFQSQSVFESGTCGDNLTWTINTVTGVLTISGKGEMTEYPHNWETPWFNYWKSFSSVVIESGVTSISNAAFAQMENITDITITDSVTSIGRSAFSGCGLSSITIPDSVTTIGENAFSGCIGLTEVHISDLDAWCGITFDDYNGNPLIYAHNLYLNDELVTNLVIPDSVTSVGSYAFYGCTGLASVAIPDSVTDISSYAFYGCTGLTSIAIPDSVTDISSYAFYGCTGLTSVAIPDNVTSIGEYAFCLCSNLTSITIPDSVTSIDYAAFCLCSSLKSITIPDSVISIVDSAFEGCSGLTAISIPDSVTSIGYDAFRGCSSLKSITIPDSVTSIGSYTFYDCNKLTDIYFYGTEAEWNAIKIGTGNDALKNATIHFIEPHTHNYVDVVTEPTCMAQGYTTHTCSCGDTYVDSYTDALGHDIIIDATVLPTCTQTGLTEGAHCYRCDYAIAQTIIPALDHSWDNGVITTQPTETTEGIKTFTCVHCGATRTESVPVSSHVHSYTAKVTAPTCTEKGYTTYTCACGDSYVTDFVAALGHNFVGGVCTRCGLDDPNFNPPTPMDPCEGYTDINRNGWYHSAADFVIARGIMGSTQTNALTFEPNTACTRSMIVSILYRLSGSPKVTYEAKFPDVGAGKWFSDAVIWAYQNGIVSGYSNGNFGPNDQITREQMAVILKGYADSMGKNTEKIADLSDFPDCNKVTWSKAAVRWAVAEGLISGKAQNGQTLLDPQGNATRAEVASILMRFIQNIIE